MKRLRFFKALLVSISIMSLLMQSVYALSAPCPDHMAMQSADTMSHVAMNHASMDHSKMGHMIHDMADDMSDPMAGDMNCCESGDCPMNACAGMALLIGLSINPVAVQFHTPSSDYSAQVVHALPTHPYRPPILA